MEQQRAVRLMMLSIKLEEKIPEFLHSYVREKLSQMYAAGFDEGREQIGIITIKVGQFDSDYNLINTYADIKQAAARSCYKYSMIVNSIKSGKITRNNQYWRWVDGEKNMPLEADRDAFMY